MANSAATSAHLPSWNTCKPPMPEPTKMPQRVLSSFSKAPASFCLSKPAWIKAFLPATMVYFKQSSYRRAFFLSISLLTATVGHDDGIRHVFTSSNQEGMWRNKLDQLP